MCRPLLVALLISMALVVHASAETVRVRTGDHAGFTRIVLEFSSRPTWTAGRTREGYAIRFAPESGVNFDLKSAFTLIDRDRISDLRSEPEGGSLSIDLACDCVAEFSDYGTSTIVIDISIGPPLDKHRFEPYLDQSESPQQGFRDVEDSGSPNLMLTSNSFEPPLPPVALSIDMMSKAELSTDWPLIRQTKAPKRIAHPPSRENETANGHERTQIVADFFPTMSPKLSLINEFQAIQTSPVVSLLATEFSRAVAQGLISADPVADADSSLSENNVEKLPSVFNQRANLSVVTSMDRDSVRQRETLAPTNSGRTCIPNSAIDLASWGDPKDRSVLGTLRRKATAEDGSVTQSGRLALARYYIALGFGSEAEALAEELEDDDYRAFLTAIAHVIDRGESNSEVLAGQLGCAGDIALWGALAQPFTAADMPSSNLAILKAFSALPLHLRSHLGPLLSERLRSAGQEIDALTALNAVTRGGGSSPIHDLTEARLGLSGTTAPSARRSLVSLSEGTDVTAAEALLELLRDAERRAVSPEPEWVDDAPSLIRATRGTTISEDLRVAMLIGQIALGRFDATRIALVEPGPGVTEDIRSGLAHDALVAATIAADAPTFLRTEIGMSQFAGKGQFDPETRFAIAERLWKVGLYERARVYLPAVPNTDGERMIAARVLGATNETDLALSILAGSDEPDLRTEAAAMLDRSDRPSEAVVAYVSAERIPEATRSAFRNGDWAWVVDNAEDRISLAAEALTQVRRPVESAKADGELVNTRLLESTSERRLSAVVLLETVGIVVGQSAFTE